MRKIFVLLIFSFFVFWVKPVEASLEEFNSYKDAINTIISRRTALVKSCENNSDPSLNCSDIDLLSRNLIVRKTTAYMEFVYNLVEEYRKYDPKGLNTEVTEKLLDVDNTIANARYFSNYAQTQNLPELEETTNKLISQNVPIIEIIQIGYHTNRLVLIIEEFENMTKTLEREIKGAKEKDLNVLVAEKHLKEAKNELKKIDGRQKSLEKSFKDIENPESRKKIIEDFEFIYKTLGIAEQKMSQSLEILLRFSDSTAWEI